MPDIEVLCGDAYGLVRSLPEALADLILTSPPYYGLRSYGGSAVRVWGGDPSCSHRWEGDEGEAEVRGQFCPDSGVWRGQFGLEPALSMYVDHLRDLFRLCLRVLKPSGSLALNLGDSFARNPAKGGLGPGSKERAAFRSRCATWGSVGVLPWEMCEEWSPHLVRLDAYFDLDAVRLPWVAVFVLAFLLEDEDW